MVAVSDAPFTIAGPVNIRLVPSPPYLERTVVLFVDEEGEAPRHESDLVRCGPDDDVLAGSAEFDEFAHTRDALAGRHGFRPDEIRRDFILRARQEIDGRNGRIALCDRVKSHRVG